MYICIHLYIYKSICIYMHKSICTYYIHTLTHTHVLLHTHVQVPHSQGKGANLRKHHLSEWDRLCSLTPRMYCKEIAQICDSSVFNCPDCDCTSVVMANPVNRMRKTTHGNFFWCRDNACPNTFCAHCLKVVVSAEGQASCAAGHCVEQTSST